MTLYQELKEAGIETGNHYSDLYFPVSPESLEILRNHPLQHKNSTRFKSEIDGKIWVDVPFAFDPYWEAISSSGFWVAC